VRKASVLSITLREFRDLANDDLKLNRSASVRRSKKLSLLTTG
jgi:hypothetical protein